MEFKEESEPQLTTKFGSSVITKSIQELKLGMMKVICTLYVVVLSYYHQKENLTLTSAKVIVSKDKLTLL